MTDLDRRCTGPLRLGVPVELRDGLRADERVVWLEGSPVVTPIGHLPWWSTRFFEASQLPGSDEVQYCDWDAVVQSGRTSGLDDPGLQGSARPALWVAEVPEELVGEADAAVSVLASHMGREVQPVQLLGDTDAVEEHFLMRLRVLDPVDRQFDPRAAWRELVDGGVARDGDPDGASLMTVDHPIELDELWDLYSNTMAVLSQDHPIEAALEREEFDAFVTSPTDIMLVLCKGGEALSVALVSTDPSRFEWFDQRWTEQLTPQGPPRNMALIPGIATRFDRRMTGSIVELLGLLGRLIVESSTDITLMFPCNNASRDYTPHLSQKALDHQGEQLQGRVERVARYLMRGYVVS